MFERLFSSESACRRHRDVPFADERERYLRHCSEQGATRATLRMRRPKNSCGSLDIWDPARLQARHQRSPRHCAPAAVRLPRNDDRAATDRRRMPWLKLLDWWCAPVVESGFRISSTGTYWRRYAAGCTASRHAERRTCPRGVASSAPRPLVVSFCGWV
jgi:hypothetical protein